MLSSRRLSLVCPNNIDNPCRSKRRKTSEEECHQNEWVGRQEEMKQELLPTRTMGAEEGQETEEAPEAGRGEAADCRPRTGSTTSHSRK
jgi:hypothetical protein